MSDTQQEVFSTDLVCAPVSPLYEGGYVTKPVPVMVEGKYKVYDRQLNMYKDVHITREDILEYAKNTPRDVAINYEHQKGKDPVGWLRLSDTAQCGMFTNKRGEQKFGLLACMELFDEAANKVRRGVYRDGSIELRPAVKEIIGHALTGFPVMKDTQFYSHPEADSVYLNTPSLSTQAPTQPASPEPLEEYSMDEQTILSQALAKYGLKPEDLSALPDLIRHTEKEKAKAQLVNARSKVALFSSDPQGNSYLSPEAQEAAAQLLVFSENHADTEIHFGEGDDSKTTNPAGLVEMLLSSMKAVQVFGESAGVSAEHIVPNTPSVTVEETADHDRVSAITARIKANLRRSA